MQAARPFVVASLAALFLAVAAPFGMDPIPPGTRLVYWLAVLNLGTAMAWGVARLTDRLGLGERRPWLDTLALSLAVTPPAVLLVWLITRVAFGRHGPSGWLGLVGPVFLVSAAMSALNRLAGRRPVQTHAPPPGGPSDPPPPKFLERLPPKLRGADVYAVQAEDHYLRLHTSRGSDLILMRLSDAISELEGLEGAQTHRSWWVARAGYTDARRSDGRAVLALKSGAEAPVSRTYVKALGGAGWF